MKYEERPLIAFTEIMQKGAVVHGGGPEPVVVTFVICPAASSGTHHKLTRQALARSDYLVIKQYDPATETIDEAASKLRTLSTEKTTVLKLS